MDRPRNEPRLPDHAATPDEVSDPPDADPRRPGRRRHDQTYKALFAHGAAIESLIRDFLAVEWHQHLDLATAGLVPTETISAGLKRRLADFAVRVRFKGGEASVVFLVEFQASPDPDMALRTLDYAIGMVEALRANPKMLDPGGAVPLLLSYVLHTGPKRWPAEISLAALTRTPSPPRAAFPRVHASLARRWSGAAHRSLRRSFARWVDERMRAAGVPSARWAVIVQGIIQPEEAAEMGQTYYEEWVEGHERRGMAKGVKRGVVRGRQEGREEMVLRLASRKFGAETAERLEGLVGTMAPEQLVQVGDAVVDCETGDELLAEAANGASVAR